MKHLLTSGLAAAVLGTMALAPMSNADSSRMSLDTVKTLDVASVIKLLKSAEIEVGAVFEDSSIDFKLNGMDGVAVLFGNEDTGEAPFHELMLQARFDNPDVSVDQVNKLNADSRFLRAYTRDDVVYIEWDVSVASGVSTAYLESVTKQFTVSVRDAKSFLSR